MTLVQTRKLVFVAAACAAPPAVSGGGDVSLVWPNSERRANSDPWLARHYDEIRQMRPNVLVLNFVNSLPAAEDRKQPEALFSVLREGSRSRLFPTPPQQQLRPSMCWPDRCLDHLALAVRPESQPHDAFLKKINVPDVDR
jgi:hypothetical protein